jgi:hypothetical protein
VTARLAKRENGGLGEDLPGSTKCQSKLVIPGCVGVREKRLRGYVSYDGPSEARAGGGGGVLGHTRRPRAKGATGFGG